MGRSDSDEELHRAIVKPEIKAPTPPRDPEALRRFNKLWKR